MLCVLLLGLGHIGHLVNLLIQDAFFKFVGVVKHQSSFDLTELVKDVAGSRFFIEWVFLEDGFFAAYLQLLLISQELDVVVHFNWGTLFNMIFSFFVSDHRQTKLL